MKELELVSDESYGGGDGRAINRHRSRVYVDKGENAGDHYMLSRTLSGAPMFFEAYGPYPKDFRGFLPRLKVKGVECWGDGLSWKKATAEFLRLIGGEIVP